MNGEDDSIKDRLVLFVEGTIYKNIVLIRKVDLAIGDPT